MLHARGKIVDLSLSNILKIIVAIIFVVCAVIAILDMIGKIEIRKEYQRKGLFAALILEAIGLTFLFISPPVGSVEDESAPVSSGGGKAKDDGAAETEPAKKPDDMATAEPETTQDSCTLPPPQPIRAWATDNLKDRPQFQCVTRDKYPECAASLQQRGDGETSLIEARECSSEIVTFRRENISRVFDIKDPYESRITRIINRGYIPPDNKMDNREELWEYIASEAKRLNGTEWLEFSKIDADSLRDLKACDNSKCRL